MLHTIKVQSVQWIDASSSLLKFKDGYYLFILINCDRINFYYIFT